MSYQWSHGPRTWGRLLYYKFDCGGYPFFVLDTRTQRFKRDPGDSDDKAGLRNNHLLGRPTVDPIQSTRPSSTRLLQWLAEQQHERGDAPKFVVTSSVFVPNAIKERIDPATLPGGAEPESLLYEANRPAREASDSWPAFPTTRLEILRRILEGPIQNVVFLAGDIHCSNVAEIRFEEEPCSRGAEGILGHLLGLLLAVPVRRRRPQRLCPRLEGARPGGSVSDPGHRCGHALPSLRLHPEGQFLPPRDRPDQGDLDGPGLRSGRDGGAGRHDYRHEGRGKRAAAGTLVKENTMPAGITLKEIMTSKKSSACAPACSAPSTGCCSAVP